MSPTLPQPAPLQVQTLEAGKGLARLAKQSSLSTGALSYRAWAQVCSSAGVEARSVLSNTGLQGPAGSLTHLSRVLGLGIQAWAQSTAWSSLLRGWFPYAGAVLGSPKAQGKAPNHMHTTLLWS